MGKELAHAGTAQGGLDVRQILGLARGDADIGMIALVAGTGHGQLDQGHAHCAVQGQRRQILGFGRGRHEPALRRHLDRKALLADHGFDADLGLRH